MQRHVLHLGEINDSRRTAWQKAVAVFDEHDDQTRQCAIFPHTAMPAAHPASRRELKADVVATFDPADLKIRGKSTALTQLMPE